MGLATASCDFTIWISSYDPEKAYNGLTIIYPHETQIFQLVDMEGHVVFDSVFPVEGIINVTDDGNIILHVHHKYICSFSLSGTIDWFVRAPSVHHCAIQKPDGNVMYIYDYCMTVEGWPNLFLADGIREVNPSTGEVLWDWRTGDHLSTDDYCPEHIGPSFYTSYLDWTHSNTIVYREEESAVYLNIRHLDRLLKIDYPSGEILWTMGKGGDFGEGLFSHSHDPEFLANGNILMYDNGNHREPIEYSRALEIAYDPELGWAEVAWSWPPEPTFFDWAMGDADRLPNGNTLVISSNHGRIFEVTRNGEIVWDLKLEPVPPSIQPMFYNSERIRLDAISLSWASRLPWRR